MKDCLVLWLHMRLSCGTRGSFTAVLQKTAVKFSGRGCCLAFCGFEMD
jgi:hypothetical protein